MLNYWNFNKDKKNLITSFYLNPNDLDKWMYQNKASYTGNYVEGVLHDSFVLETKRGYAFFYDHYLNEWSSDYEVYFIPYKAGEMHMLSYDKLWAEWMEFEDKYGYREDDAETA